MFFINPKKPRQGFGSPAFVFGGGDNGEVAADEAETTALVARFTTPPSAARKTAINNLIKALKGGGIWTKLDLLYLFAAADNQCARLNWISTSFNCTVGGSPTFQADRGYTGDGSSSSLSTLFNPTTAPSPKFVQNSGCIGAWSRTDLADSDFDPSDTKTRLCLRSVGNVFNAAVNSTSLVSTPPASASSIGLFSANRSGSSAVQLYKNGSQIYTTSSSTSEAPANSPFLCALEPRQLAAMFLGQSLTSGEHSSFYTALAAYMAAVGA